MGIESAHWFSALQPYIEKKDLEVALLQPFSTLAGVRIERVPSVFMRFPKWHGAPFVDDFGKKSAAMVELNGQHLFAELAILRLLEADGWEGRWVNTYSGKGGVWKYLTQWRDVPRREQMSKPIQNRRAAALLESIATCSDGRYAGCWDVFAWRGDEFAFLEAKRQAPRYKDNVQESQESWLRAALTMPGSTLGPGSFAFVQWDYRHE